MPFDWWLPLQTREWRSNDHLDKSPKWLNPYVATTEFLHLRPAFGFSLSRGMACHAILSVYEEPRLFTCGSPPVRGEGRGGLAASMNAVCRIYLSTCKLSHLTRHNNFHLSPFYPQVRTSQSEEKILILGAELLRNFDILANFVHS